MKSAWEVCPDIYGRNDERKCVGCGDALKGRQRIWCSAGFTGDCETLFWQNHQWGMARDAVRTRDRGRCRRCGTTGARVWKHSVTARLSSEGRPTHTYSYKETLEVNHIEPIMGKHDQSGCHHHLDGLELLCHDCHVDETNRQFGRGKYGVVD